MTIESDQQAIGKLPRPRGRWALMIWLLLATGATIGTVLFANDARNWKLLQKRLGIHTPEKTVERIHKTSRAGARVAGQWLISLSPALPGTRFEPVVEPAQQCAALTEPTQDKPQYTVDGEGNWQCLAFWSAAPSPDAAAVFLQVRGDKMHSITSWRMKLSKADTDGTEILLHGFAMLQQIVHPVSLEPDLQTVIRDKTEKWQDFYSVLGPYVITFRQELLDPKRFNLFALKRRVDRYPLEPAAQDIRAVGNHMSHP